MDAECREKKSKIKKLVIKFLIIILSAALIIGLGYLFLIYSMIGGIAGVDEVAPPARLFDSLEELRINIDGKFLLPAYVPADVDPALHDELIETYRMYVGGNKNNAIGYVISYRYPDEMVGEMLQDGTLIHSYNANVQKNWPDPTLEKVIEPIPDADYTEEIKVYGKAAGVSYSLPGHWLNDKPEIYARLRFIMPGTGNSKEVLYYVWLSCVYENHVTEEEVRELIKGEFIKIAESMIEQGLSK